MTPEEIKALQDSKAEADRKLAEMQAELEKLKKPPAKGNEEKDDEDPEDDLAKKAEKERKLAEEGKGKTKRIQQALKFEMSLPEFTKNYKGIVPKDFDGILERANKENFDDAVAKSIAIKSSFLSTFFTVKDNYDSLTASQKEVVDGFLAQTKIGREEQAEKLYETIFEPALESIKKVRKAEQVNRARNGLSEGGNSVMDDYKDRLVKQSEAAYLKRKKGA